MPRAIQLADLYAPKLRYFAELFQLPREPNGRSYGDYATRLARTPENYCSDWNAGRCNRNGCVLHHLCEWCASCKHCGNQCPWRPAGMKLRAVSIHSDHQNRGTFDEQGRFIPDFVLSRANSRNRNNNDRSNGDDNDDNNRARRKGYRPKSKNKNKNKK